MDVAMVDEMEPSSKRVRRLRCMDWLKSQNSETKKSQQNKNDIQFIIQTNADRKKFLLNAAEDEASVPAGVNESSAEPKVVPIHRLRLDKLRIVCEWHTCRYIHSNYEEFQKHVQRHISEIKPIVDIKENVEYACMWDICGHKTPDFNEMVRHINYHAYHARLLAIGFNGRATLKLVRCRKDSSKRNQLPNLPSYHTCMWTGCDFHFNSIQAFFDHIKKHVVYSDDLICSWAGCGATFKRRTFLTIHMRGHTRERQIACYHCGVHFTCNRKLCDHLRRQNVNPQSSFACSLCGTLCATEYLLNEHARQHVSAYVCALCDMSAPTPAALACHVRYRHLPPAAARVHACARCTYRAVTESDLRKHLRRTHNKLKPVKKAEGSDPDDFSDSDSDTETKPKKKKKSTKKYACHLCPEKQMKMFSRGYRLTTHLVKEHGAQWPHGHSRFRYQISEDGLYRLTTTRYEVLEVFKKIVDRDSGPKESLTNKFDFKLQQTAEPTETTPRQFQITLTNENECEKFEFQNYDRVIPEEKVEIVMCDVDEEGNIIKSEVIN